MSLTKKNEKAGYSSVFLLRGPFDRDLLQAFVWHAGALSGLLQYICCITLHWKPYTSQTAAFDSALNTPQDAVLYQKRAAALGTTYSTAGEKKF